MGACRGYSVEIYIDGILTLAKSVREMTMCMTMVSIHILQRRIRLKF